MEKRPTDFGKLIAMILLKSLIQQPEAKPSDAFLIDGIAI
jgi:hypothetical protein